MMQPTKRQGRLQALGLAFGGLLLLGGDFSAAIAQNAAAPTNAFQGFTRNRKDPVKIEANSLEVRDKEKTAVFRGNVVVVQGDTTMRCKELVVHYEGNALGADPRQSVPATKSQQQSASAQRIRRLVATGGVIVTAKDQKAVGNTGIFDMASNTVTLDGNVVVTQGQNVMNGDKLVVNLTTGTSRLDGVKHQGQQRVKGVFVPSSMDKKSDRTSRKKQAPAN